MHKPSLAAFAILFGFNTAAAAQTDAPPPTAPEAKCATPAVADTAELEPVSGSNLVTVPVAINGTPKLFLLDVSRIPDQVSEATTSQLHLPRTNQVTGSDGFADLNTSAHFQVAMYDVKSGVNATEYQTRVAATDFTIGGSTVHDTVFLVANDRDLGKSKPYDGLLTTGLFSHYDLNLDFGGRKFSFFAPTSCTDPNQVAYWPHEVVAVVPMVVVDGRITVPVTIQGHAIDAVIDTGSDHTVMRRGVAERIFNLKTDTPDVTPAGDLRDGAGERVYQHTFPQIAFGGVIANGVPALIQTNSMIHKLDRTPTLGSRAQFTADPSDRIPDLALGMDVLRQLHLYVAFAQGKIYVTPAQ
jgi:predicted aspartyl protease